MTDMDLKNIVVEPIDDDDGERILLADREIATIEYAENGSCSVEWGIGNLWHKRSFPDRELALTWADREAYGIADNESLD